MTVTVTELTRNFAGMIRRVEHGEEIIITRRGKAVVKLSAVVQVARPRLPDLADFRASMGKPPAHPKATVERLRGREWGL